MPQRAFNPARIIDRPGLQFSYLGVIGIVVFLLLRSSFDFYMGISEALNKQEAAETALTTAARLGLQTDTVSVLALRFHEPALFRQLQHELPGTPSPQQVNRSDLPISGWDIGAGRKIEEPGLIAGPDNLFSQSGLFRIRLSNQGNIISFETGNDAQVVIGGRPDAPGLISLADSVFGYNLSNYLFTEEEKDREGRQRFTFERGFAGLGGPHKVTFNVSFPADNTEHFLLKQFSASFTAEKPVPLPGFGQFWQSTSIMLSVVFFALLILATSVRQIFRGRMEWKRSLFIFGSVTFAQYLWQVLYLTGTFYAFFDVSIIAIDQLSQLISASLYGLYAAFAYVAWESLARELKSGQIPVIDAVWRFDFMKHEVGAGILTGYGFAGFYFAILALSLYSFNLLLLPQDSLLEASREVVSSAPGLSIFLNSWLVSMIFVIAHVGLCYNIICFTTLGENLRMLLSMLIAALSIFVLLPPFSSDGSLLQTFIICLILSIPLVLAYRYFGIVSAIISWFVFFAGLRLLSLIIFDDIFYTWQTLFLIGVLIAPFALGLVSVLYGNKLSTVSSYVPAYEETIQKRLRSEKELAIAKESQFNLLPAKAPELPRLDVFGFFSPSYEVGGDFYDYQVLSDALGKPEKLALSIVDVSGKGMQAAFNAIFTSGLLLSRISTDSPAEVLTQINPTLCKKTDPHTFITCQVGYINLNDLTLELSNAGHCPPMLKRNGKCEYLSLPAPRFPLGFIPKVQYTNTQTRLEEGDLLLFYSDGLPEAQSPTGDRMDFERLRLYIETLDTGTKKSAAICEEIKRFILTFSNYELADDTTLICIKITA
ncbi:MAG: SpoIIE family protein phosphatase [Balneolales bacterium]|nr:SpoIIE family protein phosphatase [Balneolales bacterium]